MQIQALSAPAFLRPRSAAARTERSREAEDTVELQGTPPRAWRVTLGSSLEATRSLCARAIFGPVGHAIGRTLHFIGWKPKQYDLPQPKEALTNLPSSQLDRPFLLVHGWHHRAVLFESLTDKLTKDGANGGQVGFLRDGALFEDAGCTRPLDQPTADMRVFVSMFTTYRDDPDAAAPQLKRNLDFIRNLTGQSKVDVAAHSMGGLATRRLVDLDPQHGIGKFMMVGTPNQGTAMAGLSELALDAVDKGYDLRWSLDLKDVQPSDRPALQWLKTNSPVRNDMNSRWAQGQKSLEAVVVVGSHDKLTPGPHMVPAWGDKLIASQSLELEGTDVRYVRSRGAYSVHGNLLWHPDTYTEMQGFFGWK